MRAVQKVSSARVAMEQDGSLYVTANPIGDEVRNNGQCLTYGAHKEGKSWNNHFCQKRNKRISFLALPLTLAADHHFCATSG